LAGAPVRLGDGKEKMKNTIEKDGCIPEAEAIILS
jgi:hypothetical protein